MRERPILFSSPMVVRAILSGAKTQTRRIIKPQPQYRHGVLFPQGSSTGFSPDLLAGACPFGKPGDRLWVREPFACVRTQEMRYVEYKADRSLSDFDGYDNPAGGRWRPSIHMPRWASRILLEITGVRVERLHEISEADAQAEGVERVVAGVGWRRYCDPDSEEVGVPPCGDARRSFRSLWKFINGDESWNANPWVWVVEFKRVQP